jgi:beta-1,4-mannosyltransferase
MLGLKVGMATTWHQRCGIASYSENLSNALAKSGVEVYIVRIPRFGKRNPGLFHNLVESIPEKVDLVHVCHEYGLWQGLEEAFFVPLKERGKKVITTMHNIGNWSLDLIIGEASDKLVVHNEYCFNRSIFPEKTVIIPHGANPCNSTVPREEAKKSMGISTNAKIVGYLGFISPAKGLERLIEAMEDVPKVGLLIAGGWFTGAETEYIARLRDLSIKRLPGRCNWIGFVRDEDLPRVYGAMDLVVYPPHYTSESGALLMALSHGKAVIASNLAPMREKEKLGALATFENTRDLAEKIRLYLEDEEARSRLEEGARKYVESVSWPNIAKKHLELYESALSEKA